jgi:hypothetical protein
MPQITIELSEEAYALLQNRARDEAISLEEETTEMVVRALAMTLPEGLERWRDYFTSVTTIKGFVSTLLMDDEGNMFTHSDRREFYEIIENECGRLKEGLDATFRKSRQTGSNLPLLDDMPYRMALAKLRRLCIQLLSEAERLATTHQHFDDEARQALATVVQTECDALMTLAQSLSRSDIPAAGA